MENAGRFVEDEELKEQLKEGGIGTPATRAAIIERLIKVDYVQRKGKSLVPTQKGINLIKTVPQELKSPQTTGKWEKGLSVPDSDLLIKLAEILDVPVSRLLGSKIEAETKPDALAEQLSRINEQLAIKNRRAKRVWKVFAFIIGGIIVMYILGIIAFTSLTAHPAQSNTEETSQVIVGTETDN